MRTSTYALLTLFLYACGAGDDASDPSDLHDHDLGASYDDEVDPSAPSGELAAATDAGVAARGPGTWTTGAAMPTRRTELAVAELNGKIYVAGGYGGTSAFEAYDPRTNRWERRASLPAPRNHPSLAALDGKIYMTGGTSDLTFAYDPSTNRWSSRAPLVHQRYASAAVVLDGMLYLVGGTGPNERAMQRYDPRADRWTVVAELSVTRDHVAAVVLDGKIWALGGRIRDRIVYNTTEIYDPATQRFLPGPSMRDSHSGFGAAVVNGKIYVAGGEVLVQPYSVRDSVEELDPASGTWRYQAKLPYPLHGTGATSYGGRMYLFGGASRAASASPRPGGGVNIFTPAR